jgi:porphobilinogen synthase
MRETRVTVDDLVCPVFVGEGLDAPKMVGSMSGIRRIPPEMVAEEISEIWRMGIPSVMLFGIPESKDTNGTSSYDEVGVVQNAIREAKKTVPEMVIMADVCMCQYTSTGHCGIVTEGVVDNDSTIQSLGKISTSYARAGVDVVSPSAMMDGQVSAIRSSLDEAAFQDVMIMPHSVKHYSTMYSPFRDAAYCSPQFGDRQEYQMSYANPREAMMEVESDISEGADIVMIKPAMAYLDLVAETKRRFDVPVAAYSVSGEYAMVHAAHSLGWLDGPRATLEILSSIKRAGADIIVTYFAKDAAGLLS